MNVNTPPEIEKKKHLGVIRTDDENLIKELKREESMSDPSENDLTEKNEEYRTGRWHPSEHYRFIKGCLQYGNNWKKVS